MQTTSCEQLRAPPIWTNPLAEAPAAIRHLLDGRARGKLVISVSPRSAPSPEKGSTP